MMFNQLSLRYALSIWIILLTLLFTIMEVTYSLKSRETALLDNSRITLRTDGNRLSAQVEQILRKSHMDLTEKQDLNRLFGLYLTGSTTKIDLMDNKGISIVSVSLSQKHEANLSAKISTALAQVRKKSSNVIVSDDNTQQMYGIFSVRMPPCPGELYHNVNGTLIISISNHKALQEEYVRVYQAIMIRVSAIFILVLAIILFIRQRVVRPILSMSETIYRISNGDSNARIKLSLNDELGKISNSFNGMLDDMESQKKRDIKTIY